MIFNVGDVVKCINDSQMKRLKNGQHYTIKTDDGSYLYFKEIEGGFLKRRFRPTQVMADISEYDDIMLAQDIYGGIE
jgi:hypothetical protein